MGKVMEVFGLFHVDLDEPHGIAGIAPPIDLRRRQALDFVPTETADDGYVVLVDQYVLRIGDQHIVHDADREVRMRPIGNPLEFFAQASERDELGTIVFALDVGARSVAHAAGLVRLRGDGDAVGILAPDAGERIEVEPEGGAHKRAGG